MLSGELAGNTIKVSTRGKPSGTEESIQKLIDTGLEDGGYIEIKLIKRLSDTEFSAHRLDLVAPSSDENTIVVSGFLGTLGKRPNDRREDWLATFIDLRQRKTAISLAQCREIAVSEYLSLGLSLGVGRPGFILRVLHPEIGAVAASCTLGGFTIGNHNASETVYDRFVEIGEKFFEIATILEERGGSGVIFELLPTVTLPIDRDYESRFLAESSNHSFIRDNLPSFTPVIAGFRRSRKGIWKCFHFSPRFMDEPLLSIDHHGPLSAETLKL